MVGEADWWARGLALAAIAVGLIAPTVTLVIWNRRSRLKVTITHVTPTQNRLEDVIRIEVQGHGSQPAVVRRIELGQRVPTIVQGGNQQYGVKSFTDAQPTDGKGALDRTVSPTDYVTADVPITKVGWACNWPQRVQLQAMATRGDGKAAKSKLLTVTLPKKPLPPTQE